MTTARQNKTEPKTQQRHFPRLTVALVILTAAGLWYYGASYYALPIEERPDSPLHKGLAPSADIGRWLGIAGTLMMTSILLYSLRKKLRLLERAGNIRMWLSVHIFMGLMGPVLITFHTGFKLGGIVSIAYWSMIISMLSGIFGRYIYIQIPRDTSGERLSKVHLAQEEQALDAQLAPHLTKHPALSDHTQGLLSMADTDEISGMAAIKALLVHDLSRPRKLWNLRKVLNKQSNLNHRQIRELLQLIKRRSVLARRLAMVDTMEEAFHHWHVLHRPFVWIMFTIVILHVGVAILFGYA